MMAMLSFVASYWQWLLIGLALAAALGYVAFVLKNWRAAAAVAVLGAVVLMSQAFYAAGYKARLAEDVKAQTAALKAQIADQQEANEQLKERLDALQRLTDEDNARAENDKATIETLQKALAAIPHDTTPALPRAAVGRIRGIK